MINADQVDNALENALKTRDRWSIAFAIVVMVVFVATKILNTTSTAQEANNGTD